MKSSEFREVLAGRISPEEKEMLRWSILSCLELTFVEKQPMHPQKSAKWVSRDGHYYCPSMNKDSII